MIQIMLMVHSFLTPFIASHHCESLGWAVFLCFLVTGSFWSLVYIAREIDSPFGDDPNDFDLIEMQQVMNNALLTLLQPRAQIVPRFNEKKLLTLCRSDTHIEGRAEAARKGTMRAVRDTLHGAA